MPRPVHFFQSISLSVLCCCTVLLPGGSYNHDRPEDHYAPNRLFSVAEMVADIRYYQAQLDRKHPNAYLYTSKKDLDAFFDSLIQSIRAPMTETAFFDLFSLANSRIRDGHTHIFPSEAAMDYHFAHSKFLPLKIKWVDGKMYAIQVYSDNPALKPGAEIVGINGIPAADIHHHLMERQIRDGYNTTYPAWILNSWFAQYYSFHYGHPDEFLIRFNTAHGVDSVRLPALLQDSIAMYRRTRYKERTSPDYKGQGITLHLEPGTKTAVLSIRDFHKDVLRKKYGQHFRQAIRNCFQTIENESVEHLILDLRDNQGGDADGAFLLSYLIDRPFRNVESLSVVRKNRGDGESRTRRVYSSDLGLRSPQARPFRGKLYVLINGGSFSNSGMVCSSLRCYTDCIFIGEETGGNAQVLSGSANYSSLPNTRLKIMVPTLQYCLRNVGSNTGHGTMPDFTVTQSVADLQSGTDNVLNFTHTLIQSVQPR